jgi:hypothetical protein
MRVLSVIALSLLPTVACGVSREGASCGRIVGSAAIVPKENAEPFAPSAEAPPPLVETPPPRSPFAYANVDPDDDFVVAPPEVRPTCDEDLARGGLRHQPASLPLRKKGAFTCGAPQVVVYRGGPEKIAWSPSVMVTCTMALAIARLEVVAQEEAQRIFGKRLIRIEHVGTYACREMAAYKGWVSEHSYANAIDLVGFVLQDGRRIDVLRHFAPKTAEAKSKEGEFLRALARRAYDEEIFSNVLTPFFDALHANHFHLDLARYRNDGATFTGP